ncbi:MAG: hypothetical protein ABSC06_17075 [Rhodopila sp.]
MGIGNGRRGKFEYTISALNIDMNMRDIIQIVENTETMASLPITFILDLPEPAKQNALKAFQSLADGQRHGDPEKLGGASMFNRGLHCSGLYAGLTEHVGDITNRMAKQFDFYKGSTGNVKDKVELGLRRCRDDIKGQVKRNFDFASHPDRDSDEEKAAYKDKHNRQFQGTYADWLKWWQDAGKRYGDAHAKLTVWNEAQWHAREAAVAIGYMKVWTSASLSEGA